MVDSRLLCAIKQSDMDINTWNSLTNTERDEIKQIGSDFTKNGVK